MEIGEAVEAARTRAALSQTAFARLLGVTQQTVSRWEQGVVRPRPAMIEAIASVLDLDLSEFVAAQQLSRTSSGYRPARRPVATGSERLPTRPLAPFLPLQAALSPEDFERFVTDLLELEYPDAVVSQLGGQGDDQRGYDILVVHPDGKHTGVQCKRVREFGPKKVAKAVAEAELEVDESILALAKPATAEARFEIARYAGWQLWDQADLSRKVRHLPAERALRLVRTYFPDQIESFLGHKPASAWWEVQDFYRPSSLLDHRQKLVGRANVVDRIASWITGTTASKLALLVGRGGLGKSKLLWEVANQTYPGETHFRFLAVGQQPTADDFNLLPRTGNLVVVVDDAHGTENIASIAAQLWHTHPEAKVILATRPYGRPALEGAIWALDQAVHTVESWTLDDLSRIEALDLVVNLVGRPDSDPFVQQLASISADCPFIAIIASDLLKRGALAGVSLTSEGALREEVFRRFSRQMTGGGSGTEAVQRMNILSAVAAFQPVRLDDPEFEAAMTKLAGIGSWDVINGHIRELEDAGLLLRRGRSAIRVVPDMFGDVLLGQASYDDRADLPTSFLSRARNAAQAIPLQHLLVNASRVDWQLRVRGAKPARVVEDLWDGLRSELLASSYERQLRLLDLVSKVAYYLPDRAMALVKDLLKSPRPDTAKGQETTRRWAPTREDVVHAVAPVLRNVAYHLDHVPSSIDVLWALAQEDQRAANQHPDHPVRVLGALAELNLGRPIAYTEAVIDAATIWLTKPSQLSPFDVLDPILAVEGSTEFWSGSTLAIRPFGIKPSSVQGVRQRVVDLAFEEAASDDLRRAVRAVKSLGKALRGPIGMHQRRPTELERAAWAREFLPIFERLNVVGASLEHDPAVRIAIREAVAWHAEHSSTETKPAAQQVLAGLVSTTEDQLALCLHSGWGRMAMQSDISLEESERARVAKFRSVAEAVSEGATDNEVLARLEQRLGIERLTYDGYGGAHLFLAEFFRYVPTAARHLCEEVLRGQFPELGSFVSVALSALADHHDVATIPLATDMLNSRNADTQRAAAEAISWRRGGRTTLFPGELGLLSAMAGHANEGVRAAVGRVLPVLGRTDIAAALQLLAQIDFGESAEVASAALSAFVSPCPLQWGDVPKAIRESILHRLIASASLDEYELMGGLSGLSLVEPLGVTRLLLARIDRQSELRAAEYRALPDHWDHALQIHATGEYAQCLREVRDWMTERIEEGDPGDGSTYGAELYELLASDWSDQALEIVGNFEHGVSDAALQTAARVLARLPMEILFRQVDLVAKILRYAELQGAGTVAFISHALMPSMSGVFSVWRGTRPKKEDQNRDKARSIAAGLPWGSSERQFFEQLAGAIETRIVWRMDTEERVFDGREW